MTLGSRGQLHVYVRVYIMCLYNLFQNINAILHHIQMHPEHNTLPAKHVTFKVHGSIFLKVDAGIMSHLC